MDTDSLENKGRLQEDLENQTRLWPGRPPGIPGRTEGLWRPLLA